MWNSHSPAPITHEVLDGGQMLHEVWLFLAGMGITLIVLGGLSLGAAINASYQTVLLLGIILLLGAAFQFTAALWGRHWRGGVLHLLSGATYFVLGVFTIENPEVAVSGLTVLVAAGCFASGICRVTFSVADQFRGRNWMLASGLLSMLFATVVWMQWPLSGIQSINLFVGLELTASGISWLLLALAVRTLHGEILFH